MTNLNVKTQPKITTTMKTHEKDQVRDIKLSTYTACHTSINSIGHLSGIISNHYGTEIKLHRTKCTGIIKYVIASCMLQELLADIGNKSFDLVFDESTDVARFKYLCFCVKYFSEKKVDIVTDFFGLIKIDKADADTLYEHVKNYFQSLGLELKKVDGMGTDGGANLCGRRHSLYTNIKDKDNPKLILIKCVCHALNLAASAASKEFPSHVEMMLQQAYVKLSMKSYGICLM